MSNNRELNEEQLKSVSGGLFFDKDGKPHFEVGDSYDYTSEYGTYRYRFANPYTVESTTETIQVQIFRIIGDGVMYVGFGDMAASQLFLMSYAGRFADDGKTKIK